MIRKSHIVESLLTQMYYYQQETEAAIQHIEDIYHDMKGLRSPNLTDVHSAPEDRQHKLIRLGEKVSQLELKKRQYDIQYKNIYQLLRLHKLEEQELRFLELLYRERLTCDEVAETYGYNNRKYVSRKRIKLLEKISSNI